MNSPRERRAFLAKALAAERAGGFRDRAIFGGLRRLAETVREWRSEGEPALPAALEQALARYSAVPPPVRPRMLAAIERLLDAGPGAAGEDAEPAGDAASGDGAQTAGEPENQKSSGPLTLASPVTCLKGLKEQKAKLLAKLGVHTLGDLVRLMPERHEDRSAVTPVGALAEGVRATVIARVVSASHVPFGPRKERLEALLRDSSGSIRAVWFNQPWLAKTIVPGARLTFHGAVRLHSERLELSAPEVDRPGEDQGPSRPLVPIYPLTAGLFQRSLGGMARRALALTASELVETLPPALVEGKALPSPAEALRQVHSPVSSVRLAAAQRRLRFEELFFLELAVAVRRQLFTEARSGVAIDGGAELVDRLLARLPFSLTVAQRRAAGEIRADLARTRAMARLLQGDVGAGKTVVALVALMAAAGSGWQGALMAPTEILAGQHYLAIRRLCGELGVGVELVTGSQTGRERSAALKAITSGASAIAVGTHALVEGTVEFAKLGLAIVDEQHRFGVHQRAMLKLKGDNPNLLVMTATPIPRTLALTSYGDLDVSVVDEMPPGRRPIETRSLPMEKLALVWERIREDVAAGRQAYVVCPLVEESDKLEAEAAEATFVEVREKWLSGLRIALLHGRMPGPTKSQVMEAMRQGESDVLVSTTVVEVGVDVPNATVMVVLNAERFGLAQLHQLRGRIGRGPHPSIFFPVVATRSREVRERMRILEETSDGFRVAERDLELRGPGEFFGTRQSGLANLRVAALPRDFALLEEARGEAFALIEKDPRLEAPELTATREELFRRHGAFVNRRH